MADCLVEVLRKSRETKLIKFQVALLYLKMVPLYLPTQILFTFLLDVYISDINNQLDATVTVY